MNPVFKRGFLRIFLVLLITFSCEEKTEIEVNSYPSWNKISRVINKNSVVIFNIGDYIVNNEEHLEMRKIHQDINLPISLKVGGNEIRQSYISIIKKKLKEKAVIVSLTQTPSPFDLPESSKKVQVDAINFPISSLKVKNKQKELTELIPWVNSNILQITTAIPYAPQNVSSFKMINSDIKLMAINGPSELKKLTSSQAVGLYFQDEVSTLIKNKNKGLNLLLYNGETSCQGHLVTKPTSFLNKKEMTLKCPQSDHITRFVKRLPPNSLDLIVIASSKQGAGFIGNIPVLFSGHSRDFIYPIILSKKRKDNMSYFVPAIKLCHKVFASTKDCVYEIGNKQLDKNRQSHLQKRGYGLIPAMFLGHEIGK